MSFPGGFCTCEALALQASRDCVKVLSSISVPCVYRALFSGTLLASVMQFGLCMFFVFISAVKIAQFPLMFPWMDLFGFFFLPLLEQKQKKINLSKMQKGFKTQS